MSIAQKIASGFNTDGVLVGANEQIYTRKRNLLSNGDMAIAQRNSGTVASVNASGFYTLDRWNYGEAGQGTVSLSQESNAALQAVSEFHEAFLVNVTTADTSLEAGHNCIIRQTLLANDVGHRVGQGTSRANPLTLSFWIKCVKTGLNIVELRNIDSARSCSLSYTVSASDTWEFKTVTFPADTGGSVPPDDFGEHFQLNFWFSAGTTYTSGTLQTAWGSLVSANRAVGQVNHHDSTSNTVALSGVQLEIGSTATPFEKLSFNDNLEECRQYYQKSYKYGIAPGFDCTGGDNDSEGAVYGRISTSSTNRGDLGVRFVPVMVADPTVKIYSLDGTSAGTIGSISDCTTSYNHSANYDVDSCKSHDSGFDGINLGTATDAIIAYHYTADTGF